MLWSDVRAVGKISFHCPPEVYHLPSTPMCSLICGCSERHHLSDFIQISLCRRSWLNYWPLGIELNLQPLSPPLRSGDGVRSSSKQGWVFLLTRPLLNISWDPDKSHFISINSGMIERCLLWIIKKKRCFYHSYHSENSKGLRIRCCLPETQNKDQIYSVVKVGTKTKYFFYTLLSKHQVGGWKKHLSQKVLYCVFNYQKWIYKLIEGSA